MIEIIRQSSQEEARAAGGEQLNNLLLEHKKQPILLMLSAGSALGLLDYVNAKNTGEHLTVAMLDDRFSEDPAVNNFTQLQKTDFFAMATETETNFFGSLPRPNETIKQLAERVEKNLKTWRQENPHGKIFATLGMGSDGHTAGIFPHPENQKLFYELFENNNWVTAYLALGKHKYEQRVTTTLTFLKLIDVGIGFVCGQEKKPKLDEVISDNGDMAALPALSWQEIKKVKIFTDC